PKPSDNKFVLVLDAGHGGKDYGAVGKITNEKTINLDVVLLVGEKLQKAFGDKLKVVYTRDNDRYLSLNERAAVANKSHGNVFVSVHVNSVDRRNRNRASIKGASVYTLGLHKADANLGVAQRENAVMTLDDNFKETYEGFDPHSAESYIIFEFSQNLHMAQSVRLANEIQTSLVTEAGRADRGVRQDGFWVLWATGMPSVLVELDFICNPEQEKFLDSSEGKEKMAHAIAGALSKYIASTIGITAPDIEKKAKAENKVEDAPKTTPVADTPKDEAVDSTEPVQPDVKVQPSEKVYKIQFLTSSKKLNETAPELKGLNNIDFYMDHNVYKYTYGSYAKKEEAQAELNNIRKTFKEAFVVALRDGKRVDL
ncbi:MAG: N-acetylmuramoyl-L-alanine amidase, partial [Muribaculaceae bacterium]|nr:N-acetylmuramoyl-L-alanine amidase [Muribaculaceae bacterium]